MLRFRCLIDFCLFGVLYLVWLLILAWAVCFICVVLFAVCFGFAYAVFGLLVVWGCCLLFVGLLMLLFWLFIVGCWLAFWCCLCSLQVCSDEFACLYSCVFVWLNVGFDCGVLDFVVFVCCLLCVLFGFWGLWFYGCFMFALLDLVFRYLLGFNSVVFIELLFLVRIRLSCLFVLLC